MRQAARFAILTFLSIIASDGAVQARTATDRVEPVRMIAPPAGATDNPASVSKGTGLNALSVTDTTWLYSATFDAGSVCTAQGWTSVDLTAQTGTYWHVDDYAGLPFGPLQGSKSLWCGARPGSDYLLCGYLTLPGYGNGWNQSWCTKTCVSIAGGSTADLDVSFSMRFDSEPSYDGTALEYTSDCSGNVGWTEIDGGNYPVYPDGWSGQANVQVNNSYVVSGGTVKVRLRFTSDTSSSDQDGAYPTNGAVHIDNLKVEDLALEDFEGESVGSTSSNDWESCNTSYGDVAVLMKGSDVLQEDPCQTNVSCLWTFIKNSTANYACGGHPEQKAVPYGNVRGQYVANEIWSPMIPLSGSGSLLNLQFSVYRDFPPNAAVFYIWHARTLVNGCPTPWRDRNIAYNANDKQWFVQTEEVGALVDFANATHVQFALGVLDMCPFWCGIFGTECHSHAPLFDNVKVYSVDISGPQWSTRAIDLFQDTFASDGTITGKGRADTAIDIRPGSSASFAPGDSGVVLALADPAYAVGTTTDVSGLLNDPNISTYIGRHKTKKQAYMWVAVWPQGQPNKSGDGLSEGPGGQGNRYPHIAGKDYVDSHGVTWTAIRADYTYTGNATNPGNGHPAPNAPPLILKRFNVDLNDNLFTPGDTICYFLGATSPGGTTYYSDAWHLTDNIAEVAANPMEFTILPAGGFNRGGAELYVDGADGLGDEPYFTGAFMTLGLANKIDRFDVRGSSFGEENTLATRVKNVAAQLNACYHEILWDCGSLPVTLGDGTGDPRKADDYALLNTFLNGITNNGGVYLCGDDVAQSLNAAAGPSGASFRSTFMPFTLASPDHIAAGLGVSPQVIHWPGRAFSDDFVVFGGCPALNDFDVMHSTGPSRVEMSYGAAQSTNGALLSNQTVNPNGRTVGVFLSGFSFANIRDDELNGVSDRAKHLRDIIVYLGDPVSQATGTGPVLRNTLSQNYPNPFNPQTSIGFSLKARGYVELSIYDVGGRLVRTLANESRAAGAYELTWDGRDERGQAVASGVYFYRLVAAEFTQTRKMVLLK